MLPISAAQTAAPQGSRALRPARARRLAPGGGLLFLGRDRAVLVRIQAIEGGERDGAPVKTFFPPEGVPVIPYGSGIPKTAQNPNAARLYLEWQLSEEGQIYSIKQHGNLTSLKVPPLLPAGMTKDTKVGEAL